MDKELLTNLRSNGLSTRKIASQLNVSQTTVTYWVTKYGLPGKISTSTEKYNCMHCKKECVKYTNKVNKYCSIRCQHDYTFANKPFEEYKTDRTRRQYLVRERGHTCEVCNTHIWNGNPIPIELDHIDGNHENNTLENVRLICPNCHAQTSTYKNKNRGNGRESRHLRYKQIYND